MDIDVSFPGGKRVDARVGEFVLATDQPVALGGEGLAPAPYDLFLASLATCAGIYALAFCQARALSTTGLRLVQRSDSDAHGLPTNIVLELTLPEDFPEKYRAAIVRAVDSCKVKRTLAAPPTFAVLLAGPPAQAAQDLVGP